MNRNYLFFSTFSIFLFVSSYSGHVHDVKSLSEYVVNAEGQVSEQILELLKLTGMRHDGSLESIVPATQDAWLRKAGVERWEIADRQSDQQEKFFEIFQELNLLQDVQPKKKHYDYAVWCGAAFIRLQTRLQYLIDQFKQGVRFDNFVLLAGARALTEDEKKALKNSYEFDENFVQTEYDAMMLVYQSVQMPKEMRALPFITINVPMKVDAQGQKSRPTTQDTVISWLQTNPTPGTCLVISNQPYITYQESVLKAYLPFSFTIETVGHKSEDTNIDLYLDTLARILYQEKKRLGL